MSHSPKPQTQSTNRVHKDMKKEYNTNSSKEKSESVIKLKCYCPTASKIAQIMAVESERLDLGTIARVFGLEPSTLKLNGHFISRGVDFVASSVTWRSLLSFFSSKGLSTGIHGSSALVVDGKLSKPGSKRSHDPSEVNRIPSIRLVDHQKEDIKPPDNKKLKERHTEHETHSQTAEWDDTGLKRKHWLENLSLFKKLKVSESYSNDNPQGDDERNKQSCSAKLPCGYLLRETTKRMREDEVLVAAPVKRAR